MGNKDKNNWRRTKYLYRATQEVIEILFNKMGSPSSFWKC